MFISFTGIAYAVAFLGLAVLLHRFYHYWHKQKTLSSGLFVYSIACFDLFFFITAIGGIFFAKDPQFLKMVVVIAAFLQGLAAAFLAYMIIYIKSLRVSPLFGFISVLIIGVIATVLTIIGSTYPFLEKSGAINWDINSPLIKLANNIRSLTFFAIFIPTIIVLFYQSRLSKIFEEKVRAIGIGLLFLMGFMTGLFDFTLEPYFKINPISSDIALIFFSVISAIVFLAISFKSPYSVAYDKKDEIHK